MPSDILTYFVIVDFKKESDKFMIYLEEKQEVPEEYKSQKIRANGFMNEIQVEDFPIRDMLVILHIKRRRWLLTDKNQKVSRDWNLVAPGTRMTAEFSAFLKELA